MSESTPSFHEEDTRCRIMRAALEEFTLRGFKGSSMRAIADRAGVNEVTLFRHFGSKVEMLKETVVDAVSKMRVTKDINEYLELPVRDGFGQLIEDYLMQFTSQSDILMLGMTESFSHPEVVSSAMLFFAEMRALLISYLEKLHEQGRMLNTDFPVLAQVIISMLHSTPVIRKRAPEDVTKNLTDERVKSTLVELVTRAYSLEESH